MGNPLRRKFGLLLAFVALLVAFALPSTSLADDGELEVMLYDMSGRMVGSAMLTDTADGLMVDTMVEGMEPVAGDRATMFHETGVCGMGADFGADYGGVAQLLPNIQFYGNGSGDYSVVAEGWTIADLMDSDGSAYVIHADAGADIGAPIICGVVPAGEGDGEPAPAPEPSAEPEDDLPRSDARYDRIRSDAL